MSLGLSLKERVARARADVRIGVPVVFEADGRRALAVAAETVTPERLAAIRNLGPMVLAITAWRAATLKARAYDGDLARIVVPAEADAAWVHAVADPADDLDNPLKGPFETLREARAEVHRAALRLVKAAHLLPAALVAEIPDGVAIDPAFTRIGIPEALPLLEEASPLKEVVSGRVPLTVSTAGRVHVFRPEDGGEEHYVVEIGRPTRESSPLVRLHSACFTGDVLGSLKCDCGPQLHAALDRMGREGSGLLLYLNQEGRGIGLANKMRAYALQDQGFDTVEANHRLGFEDDERDFRTGAAILRNLGVSSVRLLTNNPAKVAMMAANGIEVEERVPLKVGLNPLNAAYLDVKAKKSGHIL